MICIDVHPNKISRRPLRGTGWGGDRGATARTADAVPAAIFIGAVLLVRRVQGLPISRDRNVGVAVAGVEVGAGTALRPVGPDDEHVTQEAQQRHHPDGYPH